MNRGWLSTEHAVSFLGRALTIAVAVSLCLTAWLGITMMLARGALAEARQSMAAQRKSIGEYRALLAKAETLGQSQAPTGSTAVSMLQSALVSLAGRYDCSVTEFTSSRNPSIYLSRYQKETKEAEWLQVEVRTQILGTAKSIVQLLGELGKSGFAFEIQSLDMVRQAGGKAGALVSTQLALNVLIAPGGTP